jgi:hypothetical protein
VTALTTSANTEDAWTASRIIFRRQSALVPLTADQQRVIQAVYDVFRESGEWPVVDAIDRIADERWDLDSYAVLRSIPEDLAQFDRRVLRDDTGIRLRVRAIVVIA